MIHNNMKLKMKILQYFECRKKHESIYRYNIFNFMYFCFSKAQFLLYWEETENELFTLNLELIPLSLFSVVGSLNSQLKKTV